MKTNGAGKGSKPKTYSTSNYINNYEQINWGREIDDNVDSSYSEIIIDESARSIKEEEQGLELDNLGL